MIIRVINSKGAGRAIFLTVPLIMLVSVARAQLSAKAQEIWPSLDVYYRLNKNFRLYGTVAGVKQESSYADGTVGVFMDYFAHPFPFMKKLLDRNDSLPGHYLSFRFGYQNSGTPPNRKDPFRENIFVGEANGRFYLPYEMLATLKNRFDGRFSDGDFSLRYRPRLQLERDFKTAYLSFTVSTFLEYFANFGQGNLNRFRTQFAVEFRVTRHINYQVLWNHQFENDPDVDQLDAFGMVLKMYFSRKKKNQQS